jgi:hypothetical protein
MARPAMGRDGRRAVSASGGVGQEAEMIKVFWFFFSKKNRFLA